MNLLQNLIKLILSLFQNEDIQVKPNPKPLKNTIPEYVTEKEYLKGRDLEYPLTVSMRANMETLLRVINILRHIYGKPFNISSGYRPGHYNTDAGGSLNSAHLLCLAIDIVDTDGKIKDFLLANKHLLIENGLYMEHPDYTPTWCHLQIRPTKNRIFIP